MNSDGLVARLAGVSHRYGDAVALDDVHLEVPAGCVAGLIGPDGVGKSTLLGLVAGTRRVQSGRVEVLGGDIGSRRHRRRVCPDVAYLAQGLGTNLYPDLSVAENAAERALSLPIFAEMTDAEVDYVASTTARLLS